MLYIIQNFPGVTARLKESGHMVARPLVVGPIVDRRYQRAERTSAGKILVNLGGLESHLIKPGSNSAYAKTIARMLKSLLKDRLEEIVICGGQKGLRFYLDDLRAVTPHVRSVSHSEFLWLLSQSTMLITSPGLTATLEAFVYGVPVVFLPPQNFSQFFNLSILRDAGVASGSVHLADYFGYDVVVRGMPEAEGVEAVLDLLRKFDRNSEIQADAVSRLRGYMNVHALKDLGRRQVAFAESLGTDGTEHATASIDAALRNVSV